MAHMIVQIVGGPEDGTVYHVLDNTRSINFIINTNVDSFISEEPLGPLEPVTTKTITLPIKLTYRGYRVYWPSSI